jgi:hypothetical protein
LNPEWDFDKHGATVAKVEGKGSIARYRNFFRRFEMRVAVLADLDAVLAGFDKLGASRKCHELRDRVVARVNLLAEGEDAQISSRALKSLRNSGSARELWRQAQAKREEHVQGLCEWEEVNAAVSAFFDLSASGTARRVLEEAQDAELKKMKLELLAMLRQEDIYVWERGAIEDYYPPLEANQPKNKNDRARQFCERYNTADDIRSLPVFKDTATCEFDLIFEAFFGSPPSQDPRVELPRQAAISTLNAAASSKAVAG